MENKRTGDVDPSHHCQPEQLPATAPVHPTPTPVQARPELTMKFTKKRRKKIKLIKKKNSAQPEFLLLHYPEPQAARTQRRLLCHEAAWPGPTFMNEIAAFFPNVRSETMDECHLFFFLQNP